MNESPYQVLDARQIKRIEAVHGGFLYQHLYAVGCLFLAAKAGVSALVVERDEDIEIVTGTQRVVDSDVIEHALLEIRHTPPQACNTRVFKSNSVEAIAHAGLKACIVKIAN